MSTKNGRLVIADEDVFKQTFKKGNGQIQRIDDVTASAQDQEVPSRFVQCMTLGLAYQLCLKRNPQKAGLIKIDYEESFNRAADEDKSRET